MKLILGSSSKWRAQVLKDAGYEFEIMSPDVDEKSIRDPDPKELVLKIARAKAAALLPNIHEPAILITSDQVIVCNGEVREKPKDTDEARKFLKSYTKYPVDVVNSLILTNTQSQKQVEEVTVGKISYKPSLQKDIDKILKISYALYSAGALVTENPLMQKHEDKVETREGLFWGIPLPVFEKLLAEVTK